MLWDAVAVAAGSKTHRISVPDLGYSWTLHYGPSPDGSFRWSVDIDTCRWSVDIDTWGGGQTTRGVMTAPKAGVSHEQVRDWLVPIMGERDAAPLVEQFAGLYPETFLIALRPGTFGGGWAVSGDD
jgi:hypothetical protein